MIYVSAGHDNNQRIPAIIDSSWHNHLQSLFNDPKMNLIRDQVLPKARFYPNGNDIFKVFQMPLGKIKVVALGQDPYPNGEAIGLAFAVKASTPVPASLKIIANEIITSMAPLYSVRVKEEWRTLSHWVDQEVFLINAALTVEARNSGSHIGVWQWFTREVIKIISQTNPCIWMLWGAKAQGFKGNIVNNYKFNPQVGLVDNPNTNYILEAPHPAAEAYNGGTGKKFSGCSHFNLCNEILKLQGKSIINW